MRNVAWGLLLAAASAGRGLAQAYAVEWSDPATYSLSCGSLTGNKWVVAGDSCVFLSASISAAGTKGDPDLQAQVDITVYPTGNLTAGDFVMTRVYNDQVLKVNRMVRGDTVNAPILLQMDLVVPAGSESTVQVIINSDDPTEKWRIEDNGIVFDFPSSPLPVELSSFTGEIKDRRVSLEWITRVEVNNDYFTVERSGDGRDFSAIAVIKGHGTTTTMSRYTYSETLENGDAAYYRLRQTDFDGRNRYVGRTIVLRPARFSHTLSVYPNPMPGGNVHLILRDCRKQEVHIALYGLNGDLVFATNVTPEENVADYVITRREAHLDGGAYLVAVTTPEGVFSERLFVRD